MCNRPDTESADTRSWVPAWISGVGAAIWICDPSGRVTWLNQRAETLLGSAAADCIGRPCCDVIGSASATGAPFCRPRCDVRRLAEAGREIEPVVLRVTGSEEQGRWFLVVPIALAAPDGSRPWIVHCACDVDRAHRTEEYLSRIASRTVPGPSAPRNALSRREREILQLLAEDHDPQRIAARLHVSYTTIRNHVQHILEKLEVHSTQEAVAAHLLGRSEQAPEGASDPLRGRRG